jgi:uncharacterized protein YjlB
MKSLTEIVHQIIAIEIIQHLLPDDGNFPNNALLPLIVLKRAINLDETENSKMVKELFESNGWVNAWEDGIYNYQHYHSTAHEVLGILKGTAMVQFGGNNGIGLSLEPGDVIIIPAGVAHKKLDSDDNFSCVGAYPVGQEYDMNYGTEEERLKAEKNIRALALPQADPVYGIDGPLLKNWAPQHLRRNRQS